MKALVNSVTYWDVFFLNKIFRLDGKMLVSAAVPWLSHSGDGYYYLALPLLVCWVEPTKALPFLLAALTAFAVELPLYKFMKSCIKRDRPRETLHEVYKRISPCDRFSFPSGHTAAAVVVATLVSYFFPILAIPALDDIENSSAGRPSTKNVLATAGCLIGTSNIRSPIFTCPTLRVFEGMEIEVSREEGPHFRSNQLFRDTGNNLLDSQLTHRDSH